GARRALDRPVDQRHSRREVLLDDEEITLPFGDSRVVDAGDIEHDAPPTTESDLADRVLECLRVDGYAEACGQGASVEFRLGGLIDAAVDQGGPVGAVLVGPEVTREAAEEHRIPKGSSALDVEADTVCIADFERVARDEHGLAFGAANDL